jgi:hypothetical protein
VELHFGYNCRKYIPSLGKCRLYVETRRQRDDLVTDKWLGISDLLVYSEYPPEGLFDLVESGQLGVRRRKNGVLQFKMPASWAWDDCPLGDAGGQCQFFEAHEGGKIVCLMDLESIQTVHPNMARIPSQEVVVAVDRAFSHVLPQDPTESS